VVFSTERGRDWLDLTKPQHEMLTPASAATLSVARDFPAPDLFG
jgi:hypothetical protein